MLLKEAGLESIELSQAPPESREVVAFCNKLPLALGIAGSMLRKMSLGVDGDWSGIVAVLKSEFGEGGECICQLCHTVAPLPTENLNLLEWILIEIGCFVPPLGSLEAGVAPFPSVSS